MNQDVKQVSNIDEKKPCTFCYAVRIFAIVVFLLTIAFYFYNESQKRAIVEKKKAVIEATLEAELR